MNKEISYGLSSFYYAVISDTGYLTPKPLPGAVKINLTPEEYNLTFTGLDCIPRDVESIVYGYKGTVVLAGLTADFYKDVYGYTPVAGGHIEKVSSAITKCALLYETSGEPVTRHCYYSCRFGAHEFMAETKGQSVSVATVSVPVIIRANANGDIKRINFAENTAVYQNWFKGVQ